MNLQNRLLLFLNAAVFALFVWLFIAQGTPLLRPGPNWEYKDLVAILLSVVSIVVTFVGIIVAVAAIWGYQSIKSLAQQKAEETSKAGCDSYLESESFKERVATAIREQMENEARAALQTALGAGVLGDLEITPVASPLATSATGTASEAETPSEGDEPWRD